MLVHTLSRDAIESEPLPGPSAVVCMADSPAQLAAIKDTANVRARLDLIFNDASEAFQLVRPPTLDDAQRVLQFAREHNHLPYLVVQCQVGIGRSNAVAAALLKLGGLDPRPVLHRGTYNRALYRLLLEAAGLRPEPEPLVSLAVRVKYGPDRLQLFLLSMRRQRYDNWEVVAVTDGPNAAAAELVQTMGDPRVRLIETPAPLGQWGHPYRQLALDACRGEFIGLSNDDNYYVPGYLEQMVHALENADLALCQVVHSYLGWGLTEPGADLGAWMARATLIRRVPFPGTDFHADRRFLDALETLAAGRIARVDRPLFVHN
jgi:hypothetical protein